MRTLSAALLAASTLAFAPAALAEEPSTGLSSKGTVLVGAERVWGWSSDTVELTGPGGFSEKYTETSFGLFWKKSQSPFALPRMAFDVMVIDGVSVGGALGYMQSSFDNEDNTEDEDSSGFLFAPRAGYLLNIADVFGIWPRVGVTYYGLQDPDFSQFAIDLELNMVLRPAEGIAFTGGLVWDYGLTGSADLSGGNPNTGVDDLDFTDRHLGILFGITSVL